MPEFIAEAEQQLLGAALKQWHSSAEGVVASSILEVRVIEQRLLYAVYRYAPRIYASRSSCVPHAVSFQPVKSQGPWVIAAGWCSMQVQMATTCWNCLTLC